VVFGTLADAYTTNRHRLRPIALKEIQLKATGSNIYNADELHKKEALLESYNRGMGEFNSVAIDDKATGAGAPGGNISCNPQHFYEINFKHPMDMSKVSASGSVAMGQLSVPTLRVVVAGVAASGGFGSLNNVVAANVDIHVVAYTTSLISYNTNTSGSTHIRQIMN